MQRSSIDLTLPDPGKRMSLPTGAQDNGSEANLLSCAPSKCLQVPVQNKDQENQLPVFDNCKPIQADSQHNGPNSDSCSRLDASMPAPRVPSSKKKSKNKDNGDKACVWSKLGAMKCKHCGLLTSDAAVLNAHSCFRRNNQTSKLRESTTCGPPISHPLLLLTTVVGKSSDAAELGSASHLCSQNVQRPTINEKQQPLSSSSSVIDASNKPVVPSSTNAIEKQQKDTALVTLSPCISKARKVGIVMYDPVSDNYTCQVCCFSAVDALFMEHLLSHMISLPYSCTYCDRKFKTRKTIRKHCNDKHPELAAKSALNGVRGARIVMLRAKRLGKAKFSLQLSEPDKVPDCKLPSDDSCASLAVDKSTESSDSALRSCAGAPATTSCISGESSVSDLMAADSESISSASVTCSFPEQPLANITSDGCSGQSNLIKKTAGPLLASRPAAADIDASSRSDDAVDLADPMHELHPSQGATLSQEGAAVSVCSSATGSGIQENCERSGKQGNMEEEESISDLQISSLQGNYVKHFTVQQEVQEAQASQSCAPSQLSISSSGQNHSDQDAGTLSFAISSCHNNYNESNSTENQSKIPASSGGSLECVTFNSKQGIPVGLPRFSMFSSQPPHASILTASPSPGKPPQMFPTLAQDMAIQKPSDRTVVSTETHNHNADRGQQMAKFDSLPRLLFFQPRRVFQNPTQHVQMRKKHKPLIIMPRSPSGPATVSIGSKRPDTVVRAQHIRPTTAVSTGVEQLPVAVTTGSIHTPTAVGTGATGLVGSNPQHVLSLTQNQHPPTNCSVTGVSSYQVTRNFQPFSLTTCQSSCAFMYNPALWSFSLRGIQTTGQIPQPSSSREAEALSVTAASTQHSDFAFPPPQIRLAAGAICEPHSVINRLSLQGAGPLQNATTAHFSNTRHIDTQQHGTSVTSGCTPFTASGFSSTELLVPTASGSSTLSSANPVLANILSATDSTNQTTTIPVMGQQSSRETDSATVTAAAACTSLSSAFTSTVIPVSELTDSGNHDLQISMSSSSRFLPSIKKEHPEPPIFSETTLSTMSCDTQCTPRIATSPSEPSASTLTNSFSTAEPRSYMMWNNQFVCLLCRKRFRDKQEFYLHVWNHEHANNKKCPQCGVSDSDPVCSRTDETIRDTISKVNLIDACILNHVGNPQIREKILKILIPGDSTEHTQACVEVTEKESPQHLQASSCLNDIQPEAVSAASAESIELMATNAEISDAENAGDRVFTSSALSTITVQPSSNSVLLLNAESETIPISATNAVNVLGTGESVDRDQMPKECVRSKNADDPAVTMVSLENAITKAHCEMANTRTSIDKVEGAHEETLWSLEVENVGMTSGTAHDDVTQVGSVGTTADTTACGSEMLTALSASAEMLPSIEDAAETLAETPPHDFMSEMANTVTKNCTDVSQPSVFESDTVSIDIHMAASGNNREAVHFSLRNGSNSEDTLQSIMPDDGPRESSESVQELFDPVDTGKRERNIATIQSDASITCPESPSKQPTQEHASSLNFTHTVLPCPKETSGAEWNAVAADESGLPDVGTTHPLNPKQGTDSIFKDDKVRCMPHGLSAATGTTVKTSWPLGEEDETSSDEVIILNEENVTRSFKKTSSVLKTEVIESNDEVNGGVLEAVRDCALSRVTSAAKEIQYCGWESLSEPEINNLESAELGNCIVSSPTSGTKIPCDIEDGSSANSSDHPGAEADMEDRSVLRAAGDDVSCGAYVQAKDAPHDLFQESEQTGLLAGKKVCTTFADKSSCPVSDRLSMFYICSMCPFSCYLAIDFTMHLNSCHDDDVEFVCYYCHYRGKYTTDLTNHITEHTISRMVYRCPVFSCSFGAESIQRLEQHIKTHAELTECCCRQCAMRFACPSDLLSHFKEHSMTLFSCGRCPARFLSKAAIMCHCQHNHAGTCLFRVLGMCLCHERKKNGYKSFISECLKVTEAKSEARVGAASRCQDESQMNLATVPTNGIEHGSHLLETSKLSKLDYSTNVSVHCSDASASPGRADSLRVRMETANKIKNIMLEAGLPVKQGGSGKMTPTVTSPEAVTVAKNASLFHPMVSAPVMAADNMLLLQLDVPCSKQFDMPLSVNGCSDKAGNASLEESSQQIRESSVREGGFCGDALSQSSTSAKLLLISKDSDTVFPKSPSPNQAINMAACGVGNAQHSDTALSDSPLAKSAFPPAATGPDALVNSPDHYTQMLTQRTDPSDLRRSISSRSLSTALGSIQALPRVPSACGVCLSPTTKHSVSGKQTPTTKKKWSALLDFCGKDELDRAMRDVLYVQIGQSFRCYYCDRLISSLEKVHCHLFYHNKIPLTACIHCKKTGSSRKSVLHHTRQEHPDLEQNVNLLNVNTMFIAKLTSQPLTLSRFTSICKILRKPDIDYLDEHSSCSESIKEASSAGDTFCQPIFVSDGSSKLLSRQNVNREPPGEDPQSKSSKADVRPLSRKPSMDGSCGKDIDLLTDPAVEKCEDDDNLELPSLAADSSFIDNGSSNHEETKEKIILNSPRLHKCLSALFKHARGDGRSSVYTCQVCSGGAAHFPSRYKIHKHLLEHLEVRPVHCYYCTFSALEESDVSLHIRCCHQGKPDRLKHVSINLQETVKDFLKKSRKGDSSMLEAQNILTNKGVHRKRKGKTEKDPHSLKKAKKGYTLVKFSGWSKKKCKACGHLTLNAASMERHALSCTRPQKTSGHVSEAGKTGRLAENNKSLLHAVLVSHLPTSHPVKTDIQVQKVDEPEAEMDMVQYKCRLCSFQGNKIQTEDHIKTAHHKVHNKLFKCGHCNALYGNSEQLKNHTRFFHPTLPLKEEALSGTMCYMEVLPSQASRSQSSQCFDSDNCRTKNGEVRNMQLKIPDSDSDDEPIIRKRTSTTKIKVENLLAQMGSDNTDSSSDDFEITSVSGFTQSPRSKQIAASRRSSLSPVKVLPPLRSDSISDDDFEIISASGFSQSRGRKQAISFHRSSLSFGKVLPVLSRKSVLTSEPTHNRLTSHLHKRSRLSKSPVVSRKRGTSCTSTPTPEKKRTTTYRCGHCLKTFSSKKETVDHNKAKHPTQLLSLEVRQHSEAEAKMSFPEEPKVEPFLIDSNLQIKTETPDSELLEDSKLHIKTEIPELDPPKDWIEKADEPFIQCPNTIQCILCSSLFSCHSDFKVHVDEMHSDVMDKQNWYDAHSKGIYDDRGGVVSPASKVVIYKFLCAYCPTRGLHKEMMIQHHQEQHEDQPTWIIELESTAASEEPKPDIKNEDTTAEPARKKVKHETSGQQLEVVLMNIFALNPDELRNLLETNGISALNMGCLPRETFLEVLKIKEVKEPCEVSER